MLAKSKKQSIKDFLQERKLFHFRLLVCLVLIIALSCLLIFRLIYLQLVQHKIYSTLSQKNYLELLPAEANRGLIYDRNGVLLAENLPSFSLDIIPDRVNNLDETLSELQKIIPLNSSEIEAFYTTVRRQKSFSPIPLKFNLTEEQAANFYLSQHRFSGVMVSAQMLRHYPLGSTAASVVGYVGRVSPKELANLDANNYSVRAFIGKTGIERYYENLLHGTIGFNQVEVDAGGHAVRVLESIPPISGNNIYLTIDSKLQAIAYEALGSESGSVVAMIPKTGEILVLTSNPSFDPNLFAKGLSKTDFQKLYKSSGQPLYNRAIRGQFPMASTIKPYLAIEGLDSGIISVDYTFLDKGWFQLPNSQHIYRDWNWKVKGRGYINVSKAIIVSSDPFFFNLAMMLTISRIDEILLRFGFGNKTGIDLPNEADGLVASPESKKRIKGISWFPGDTVNSGIGQGDMLATPVQLASGVATLANRGLRYQPHILLAQQQGDGSIIKEPIAIEPVILKNPAIWSVVIKAMEGVILSSNPAGTGRKNFGIDAKYTVAAKTGTAQVYSKHGGEEDANTETVAKRLRNHSLFIAFAPIDDPKIAIAVVVEHSNMAARVARKVLDAYFTEQHNLANLIIKKEKETNSESTAPAA